jgi:hypothetical protein
MMAGHVNCNASRGVPAVATLFLRDGARADSAAEADEAGGELGSWLMLYHDAPTGLLRSALQVWNAIREGKLPYRKTRKGACTELGLKFKRLWR